MPSLRVALAQINTIVGDLEGNLKKIVDYIGRGREVGADVVVFPELAITGYPPEDLLLKPKFIQANLDTLKKAVEATDGITAVIGFVDSSDDIYNAAAIAHDRALAGVYHKTYLPNYGIFDEDRYFRPGERCPVFSLNGATIGVNICEDIWYPGGPATEQSRIGGAEVIINISSSPYEAGKGKFRERMISTRAADNISIMVFNNTVGGQDELVFDGHSLIFDQNGHLLARGKQFEEDFIIADLDIENVFRQRLHDSRRRKDRIAGAAGSEAVELPLASGWSERKKPPLPERGEAVVLDRLDEVYRALVMGTRDYVSKNGFEIVAVGLSGGIDSALTAAIAVDALGKDSVVAVTMPSGYSSSETRSDAEKTAVNLGIRFLTLPIGDVFQSYLDTLEEPFAQTSPGLAEENVQARIRGNFLMALSNKFGWLVLTTGNKSEMSTGYCTLYGDMAGGFAVIKDVPKTLVYELSRYRNSLGDVIPKSVIEREPTAELRPDQKDSDSLPPYPVLDPILKAYIEEDRGVDEIVALGYEEETVKKVIRLVDGSEYKRRQGPPGIKITARAFGKDRRLPITNRFLEK